MTENNFKILKTQNQMTYLANLYSRTFWFDYKTVIN